MTLSGTVALRVSCLRLLPDKNILRIIMDLVQNRSFTITTGDSKQNRIRRLKNGFPQGSLLAPLLFNLYIFTSTSAFKICRTFTYTNDLALLLWKLEGLLTGLDYKSRPDYTFSVSLDLEAEAQSH